MHFRLQERQVEALERGDWEDLPGPAYVRALVRTYAHYVEVDATPLLATLGGFGRPAELKPSMESVAAIPVGRAHHHGQRDGRSWLKPALWTAAGLAGLAVLALVFAVAGPASGPATIVASDSTQVFPVPGQTGVRQTVRSAAQAPVAVGEGNALALPRVIGMARPGTAEVSASGRVTGVGAVGAAPVAGSAAAGSEVASAIAPVAAVARTAVSDSPQVDAEASKPMAFPVKLPPTEPVRLSFTKPVWVEITHKDGERLMFGTQKKAKQVVVDGVPPMQVVLGNPSAVTVEFRGQPVDLSDKITKGVARFVLN
ncbi:MAG: DUF4115 domain-containing protein [Burkholderiaceae bacterium]